GETADRPAVRFCAHCGQRPQPDADGEVRVCARCGRGILIWAPAGTAPVAGQPFVIVDQNLTVRALSKHAEALLGVSERRAIDRRIDDLLTQVGTQDPSIPDLHAMVTR